MQYLAVGGGEARMLGLEIGCLGCAVEMCVCVCVCVCFRNRATQLITSRSDFNILKKMKERKKMKEVKKKGFTHLLNFQN